MKDGPDIAPIAALIGDPARANMLTALMTGHALTAGELAREAGVTLQTASGHLAKLDGGGLLRARRQGRHKYFELSSPEVAVALEALMGVAARAGRLRTRLGPRDAAMRRARLCYNHLAGELAVELFDAWAAQGRLRVDGDDVALTDAGRDAASALGVDLAALERRRAPICRPCLDWSARKSHLGGALGRAIWAVVRERGWAQRVGATRVVDFHPKGEAGFRRAFAL